jgi:alpha-galactosidase
VLPVLACSWEVSFVDFEMPKIYHLLQVISNFT